MVTGQNDAFGRFFRIYSNFQIFTNETEKKPFSRRSHRRCSVKKDALKNFANFTGKHLCWNLVLIKLQAWRSPFVLKRDSNASVSCEFCEIFIEHLRRLLLSFTRDLLRFFQNMRENLENSTGCLLKQQHIIYRAELLTPTQKIQCPNANVTE